MPDSPTPEAPLLVQVRALAQMRREHAVLGDQLDAATQTFVEAWKDKIEARKALGQRIAEAEAQLKAAAEALYLLTQDKAPAPGVKIKITTNLEYPAEAALEWAKLTGLALVPESFDPKALEKIAKVQPLPFVKITDVPKAQIATDLDAVLMTTEP